MSQDTYWGESATFRRTGGESPPETPQKFKTKLYKTLLTPLTMKKKKTKQLGIQRIGATGNRSRHFRPDVDGRTSSVPCLDEYNIDSLGLWHDTEAKDSRLTESHEVAFVCNENCTKCPELPFCDGV